MQEGENQLEFNGAETSVLEGCVDVCMGVLHRCKQDK